MAAPEKSNDDDVVLGTRAAKGLLLIVVPSIAAVSSAVGTYIAVQDNVTANRYAIERLDTTINQLEQRIGDHVSLGADGIPHPAGILVEIRRLSDEIQRLREQERKKP
jgi:hypothetical protein